MEVWQTSNLRPLRLGEEIKKEEEERNSMKIYMVSLLHRATINKKAGYNIIELIILYITYARTHRMLSPRHLLNMMRHNNSRQSCEVVIEASYSVERRARQYLRWATVATIDMGQKEGGAAVPLSGGAGSPSNTMWPGPRPTSISCLRGVPINRRPLLSTDYTLQVRLRLLLIQTQ